MKDKRISSIVIDHTSFAISSGYDVVKQKVHIYRHGGVKHQIFTEISKTPIREYKYKMKKEETEEFFRFIMQDIRIEEWRDDYSLPVCDGWQWIFTIRYSDNRIKKTIGTVEPPPRGNKLEKHIKKMIAFEEDPWLF